MSDNAPLYIELDKLKQAVEKKIEEKIRRRELLGYSINPIPTIRKWFVTWLNKSN